LQIDGAAASARAAFGLRRRIELEPNGVGGRGRQQWTDKQHSDAHAATEGEIEDK